MATFTTSLISSYVEIVVWEGLMNFEDEVVIVPKPRVFFEPNTFAHTVESTNGCFEVSFPYFSNIMVSYDS